jgi:hypothetical protein
MNVINHRESIGQVDVGDLAVSILKDNEDPSVVTIRTVLKGKIFAMENEVEKLASKKTSISFDKIGKVLIFLAYNFYFGYAVFYHINYTLPDCEDGGGPEGCWMWCSGIGVIIIITLGVYLVLLSRSMSKMMANSMLAFRVQDAVKGKAQLLQHILKSHFAARLLTQGLLAGGLVGFFVWDTWGDQR